jgi:Cys-rich four helix bundle protein (predicted Tat secretion target)
MIVSASLGALACGGGSAGAQGAKTAPTGGAPPAPGAGAAHHHGENGALADAAGACASKGAACVAHCLALLGRGDTSVAGCAQAAYTMAAAMEALAKVATSGSPRLAAFARGASELCVECVTECAKHADKHPACKECLEACNKAIAAVKALG